MKVSAGEIWERFSSATKERIEGGGEVEGSRLSGFVRG